ncbi:hypothetical protein NR798_16340 [Archangium gephyra]|uniref:hypothetical protein n=1 Tax=Archangium gephyra TaxID=48 RepID=UPI0035D45418
MKKMIRSMTVVLAGLPLLSACGGAELDTLEAQASGTPAAEELAQTSDALIVTDTSYPLTARGGSGGTSVTLACARGFVAVGIHGRSGWYIDQLGLVCRYLNYDGTLGAEQSTQALGGTGGSDFKMVCPEGMAITGFYGTGGSYVDQLGFNCSSPTLWNQSSEVQYWSGKAGSNVGSSSFTDMCPSRYLATSMNIRYGWHVDQFQGVCSYIAP